MNLSETYGPWCRIAAVLAGVALGAALYANAHIRWLFAVDSRYLTFTQPRTIQSLGELFSLKGQAEREQVIIFGGSAAYHALNADYLNLKLRERGIDLEAVLVSSESQNLLDTLAMIAELPERSGPPGHILVTWSFWRFDGEFVDDLQETMTCYRSPLKSQYLINLADDGKFDHLILDEGLPTDWHEFSEKYGIPSRSVFSTWLKYFLLDKIDKVGQGSFDLLLRDLPAFGNAETYSEEAIDHALVAFAREDVKNHVRRTFENLSKEIPEKFSKYEKIEWKNHLRSYIRMISEEIISVAISKGYTIKFARLPVYESRLPQDSTFDFRTFLVGVFDDLGEQFTVSTYSPNEFYVDGEYLLDDQRVWWDYVHMTVYGARLFQDRFVDRLPSLVDG